MNPNRAFWRALHSLAHPLSIGAVVLLLINDHWLRHHYPSWLTGKLGDFTWLMFAPFIAAVVFAWLIPRRIPRHERIVGLVSIGFIGVWFALAKTVPVVHYLTKNAWDMVVGWEGTLRLDPTDLLTLPALLLSWWVWRRVDNRPVSLRPLAYVVLGLGIVATLASDSPMYHDTDTGILQICEQGNNLVVSTPTGDHSMYIEVVNGVEEREFIITSNVFTSVDGGLTWTFERRRNYEPEADQCTQETDFLIAPDNPAIQYRWRPGERVEKSTNGGQSWVLEYDLSFLQQDVRRHYNHQTDFDDFSPYWRSYHFGPISGLIHKATGNVVLAMSWDGVLVRTPDAEWHWVTVGPYVLANIHQLDKIPAILFGEFLLACLGVLLLVNTSIAYMKQASKQYRWRISLIGLVAWGLLIISPLLVSAYKSVVRDAVFGISVLFLVFLATPLSIGAVWDMAHNFRSVWKKIALVAVSVGLLYLFSFLLWTQGTIPRYSTATVFALVLVGGGLYAGSKYLQKHLPVLEKPKRKRTKAKNAVPLPKQQKRKLTDKKNETPGDE